MTDAEPEMIRRVAAAQATLDEFRDKPFKMGERDCARMVAAHLRRMGHKVRLPAKGSYATVKSALKALHDRGFETLAEALDAMGFERIAPAAVLPGDVLQGDATNVLGGLVIALSNGRIVGYHEHAAGAVVMQTLSMSAAWRVRPAG